MEATLRVINKVVTVLFFITMVAGILKFCTACTSTDCRNSRMLWGDRNPKHHPCAETLGAEQGSHLHRVDIHQNQPLP